MNSVDGMPDASHPDIMEDDAAYLRMLRAARSERSQAVMQRMDRVNAVYVVTYRDDVLQKAFETFLEETLSTRDERQTEADIFFVTGRSGSGKTRTIERLLARDPSLQPIHRSFGTIRPCVSIKLTGYMLPRIAATQIMEAAGHPIKLTTRQGDGWNIMRRALWKRRVKLVHIDETQHLVAGKRTKKDYQQLADAIKGVSISETWPVAFLLSGLPEIVQIAASDEQFERRGRWVHLGDLAMPDHRRLVIRVLEKLSAAAGLELGGLPDTDTPERIAHAAKYQFGWICQFVRDAIHQAVRDEKAPTQLLRGHFALAYADRSRARDNNLHNLFMVDDWEGLPAGSYLTDDPTTDEDPE